MKPWLDLVLLPFLESISSLLDLAGIGNLPCVSKRLKADMRAVIEMRRPFFVWYSGAHTGKAVSKEGWAIVSQLKRQFPLLSREARLRKALLLHGRQRVAETWMNDSFLTRRGYPQRRWACPCIYAVPWIFRNAIDIDNYDEKETPSIDFGAYVEQAVIDLPVDELNEKELRRKIATLKRIVSNQSKLWQWRETYFKPLDVNPTHPCQTIADPLKS